MQVYFFRPKKRDELIGWIRQYGWYTRIIYDMHKVTKDIKWIVLDAAVGNWKANAAIFVKRGIRVLLLTDEDPPEDERMEAGVTGILYGNEQFCSRYVELTQMELGKTEDMATTEETILVPLSQRLKRDDSNQVILQEEASCKSDNLISESVPHQQQVLGQTQTPSVPSKPNSSLPSVVTVYGAKGGVGRTVFLLNLAAVLSNFGVKVCILDLDLYQGTVASTLHCHPEWTITDLVRRVHDRSLRQTCLLQSEMGFSFVAAPTSYMDTSGITVESLTEVIRFLKEEMDLVLIDTSTLYDDVVKVAMEQSDHVLLMTSEEPASVKNLRKMADELGRVTGPQFVIVWNRVTGHGVRIADSKECLPWPNLFALTEDVNVGNSAKHGQCMAVEQPIHPYSVQLELLAKGWTGKETTLSPPSWWKGLQQYVRQKGRRGK